MKIPRKRRALTALSVLLAGLVAGCGLQSASGAVLEALTSIRRAGADAIITYYAKDAANWLDG